MGRSPEQDLRRAAVFARKLTLDEEKIIQVIEKFVRDKHQQSDSHDHSHVLEVTQYAIRIADRIPEPVDPMILICGALLHDIGKTNQIFSDMHGLLGAALAEEFLTALGYCFPAVESMRQSICKIVARHTPTTMIPPETVEEKIVFDADTLDRLGLIGVIRGFIGKEGSIAEILENKMATRVNDFDKLHFDASRELGAGLNEEALAFIELLRKALIRRKAAIREIELHGAHDRAIDEDQAPEKEHGDTILRRRKKGP
jgi:putative nucleotidyltransferase with HDIG domain